MSLLDFLASINSFLFINFWVLFICFIFKELDTLANGVRVAVESNSQA